MFSLPKGLTGARWWPHFLLTGAMFLFASDVIVGRLAADLDIPPLGLAFWRTAGAAAILTPFVGRELILQRHELWRCRGVLVVLGLTISVIGSAAVYSGLARTTALNGGVVTTAQAAITVILGWLLFRDRIGWRAAAGLVVAAIGVLAILCRGEVATLSAFEPQLGDLLVLIGVTGYALYVVILRRAPHISLFALLCVTSWLGALFNAPLYGWETVTDRAFAYTPETLAVIVWISLFVSIGAIGGISAGAMRVGAQVTGAYSYVRTVFVAALAVAVLGEAIAPFHLAGAALIIVGVLLVNLRRGAVKPD